MRLKHTARGIFVALLMGLTTGCLEESPLDPTSTLGAFTLLGGLDPGQAMALEGDEARRLFLPGTGEGSEFVLVPFFATEREEGQITVEIRGGELMDVVGPPRGSAGEARPAFEDLRDAPAFSGTPPFHRRLRSAEIRQLEPRLRSAPWREDPSVALHRSRAADGHVPGPGDTISLRTINTDGADLCADPLERGGRVVAVTPDVIMVSDTASPAELTDPQLESIANEFGQLVEPVAVENFGAPTDIDDNDRVIVFFTPVVNELEAGGFTFTGDLFPRSECAASNEAEIFYIVSPDPGGETPIHVDGDVVAQLATGIIGHEFQHVINAGRRIYVNGADRLESVWLNEGLSHIAEELLFYETSGLGPRENLTLETLSSTAEIVDAANRFALNNLFFYASYVSNPADATLVGSDNAPTRGVSWAFLRYAADLEASPDPQFFFDLVNSTSGGIDNLNRVLESAGALDLLQAWTASVFSDDEVIAVPPFLTQPSWNYRTILPLFTDSGNFPLSIETIGSPGSVQVDFQGGGSAFFRVRVPPGGQGEFSIGATGSLPEALRVSVIRVE